MVEFEDLKDDPGGFDSDAAYKDGWGWEYSDRKPKYFYLPNKKNTDIRDYTFAINPTDRKDLRVKYIDVYIARNFKDWFPNIPSVALRNAETVNKQIPGPEGYNTKNCKITSSNPNVATYDIATGVITSVNAGTTTITVEYPTDENYNGGKKTFTITVQESRRLVIPTNDRYTVSVSRDGKQLNNGDIVGRNDRLTYHVVAKNGYKLLGNADITQGAFDNFAAYALPVDGNGIYLINSTSDWDIFAKGYAGAGNFRLGANIEVKTMVGSPVAFSGNFEGDGKTMTISLNANEQRLSPFRYINGATISNLVLNGNIISGSSPSSTGGLVGEATGNPSTINNCSFLPSLTLSFTGNNDATFGGIVGRANANVSINNCSFAGKINAPNGHSVAGFVGWIENGKRVEINNSLSYATVNAKSGGDTGNAPFVRNSGNSTVNNSYYCDANFQNINDTYRNGTQVSQDQLKSGEVAFNLQGSQSQLYWTQSLGDQSYPMLVNTPAYRIYKASFKYGDKEIAASYGNMNKKFSVPELNDYVISQSFVANPVVSGNVDIPVYKTLIETSDDWDAMAKTIESGITVYNEQTIRLANNITVKTMVGSDKNPFKGTFDGQGHTINVNYTVDGPFVAPFRFVAGGTFRNLNVTGTEHMTGNDFGHCSGLLGRTDGATIDRCTSSVALQFDKAGDAHSGGLVGHALSSTIIIRDCAFTGSFSQPDGRNESVGGLIGWGEKVFKADIANSYVDMTLTGIAGMNNLVRAYSGWDANVNKFSNCYYTVPAGLLRNYDPEPAELVTKEQIQSGYVANLLQKVHNSDIVWGQNITGDNKDVRPVITNDGGKRVYKAVYTYEGNDIATTFTNAGKQFGNAGLSYKSTQPANFASLPASADASVQVEFFNKNNGWSLIENITDWNNLAAYATKGNFRMTQNIGGVETMVGTKEKPFTGTFDGQNRTLTLNYNKQNGENDVAPFSIINGATIMNLRTNGTITANTNAGDAAGLVGESTGKVSITDCESAVAITFTGSGDATAAGVIGRVNDESDITINNCAFTGSIKADQGHSVGGFIGWVHQKNVKAAISNSLVVADINVQPVGTNGSAPFARNAGFATVTNCYYRDFSNINEGYRRGTKVTADQLKSGEVARLLQIGQDGLHWGQNITSDPRDERPVLSPDQAKSVFMATLKYNNDVKAYAYTNRGKAFTLPAVDGYRAMYNNAVASNDIDITLLVYNAGNNSIIIASKQDWDNLCDTYNGGNETYMLTTDLTGNNTVDKMVGAENNPFKGTFDGQNHTIAVNYNLPNGNHKLVAPFRKADGATFKNLRTSGAITTSMTTNDVGGIVGQAQGGKTTFVNCASSVVINHNGNSDATNGGLLGRGSNEVSFDNCAFTGSFNAAHANAFGGFVGYLDDQAGTATITNSLVAAQFNVQKSNDNVIGNAPFARRRYANKVTITNSYYLSDDRLQVGDQGTKVTADQLKSGEVAYALQGEQATQFWGQTLAGDNRQDVPVLTQNEAQRVYRAQFTYDNAVKAMTYTSRGSAFPVPTIDGYKAMYDNALAQSDISVALIRYDAEQKKFVIENKQDWDNLCDYYDGGTDTYMLAVDLTGDNTVSKMIGSERNPFKGTFDGQNHTLTVNYNITDEQYVAPFRVISGATIKNLYVAGSIQAGKEYCGGIAGMVQDATSSFYDCRSSVTLNWKGRQRGGMTWGGILGIARADVNIENCLFDGAIKDEADPSQRGIDTGGLVGWADNKATVKNSLMAGKIESSTYEYTVTNATLVRGNNVIVENSYYIPDGIENIDNRYTYKNGTPVSAADARMTDGEIAHLLQGSQAEQHWGQTLSVDQPQLYPVPTQIKEQRVYKAQFIYGEEVKSIAYANYGTAFTVPVGCKAKYDNAPAEADIDIELYDPSKKYIANKRDWDYFADNYDGGTDTYVLDADLTGSNTVNKMFASQDKPFRGTFEGQGHTLTVNYNLRGQACVAPFRFADGATFKNLRIAGSIVSEKQFSGGFVGSIVNNPVTFTDCRSSVYMKWEGSNGADMTWGGFVGVSGVGATFDNCLFDGQMDDWSYINVERGRNVGGFIGWTNQEVAINNCLMAGVIKGTDYKFPGYANATFGRSANSGALIKVQNSYYLYASNRIGAPQPDPFGNFYWQGERIDFSDAQVKSGELAYKLQAHQTEQHWGQTVDTDQMPLLTADIDKHVFKNIFDANEGEEAAAAIFANTFIIDENKGNKANITANANGTGRVKFTRTFSEGWNTLVLPFSLTTDEVNAAFGDETKVAYFTNTQDNTIELNTNGDNKAIEANTPVLIMPANKEVSEFAFRGKKVDSAGEAAVNGSLGIRFVGSYDAVFTVPANDYYFVNGNSLWRSKGNTTIKGTRGYFHVPSPAGAKVRLLIDGEENGGGTTGIDGIDSGNAEGWNYGSAVYTVGGQKVADSLDDARKSNLPAGVYIVKGKKMVIK